MIWLRIAGAPSRQFYQNAESLPHLTAGEARHELLTKVGTLRSGIDGETPNITVELRNESGQCARLFAVPPIGQQADLIDETGVRFSGLVKRVSLKSTCSIEVQA